MKVENKSDPVTIGACELPDPIPNSVVKMCAADDTEWESKYCWVTFVLESFMLEKFVVWDKRQFLKVNQRFHPKPLTYFFIFIDLLSYWGLAILAVSFGSIVFGSLAQKQFGILGVYVVSMTTLVNEVFLKGLVLKRKRPHEELENVKLYWLKPGTSSFPSGQTTSVFSWVVFFSLYYRNPLVLAMGLVFGILTAVERIWLGAHYPLDVAAGVVFGSFLGWLWYLLLL